MNILIPMKRVPDTETKVGVVNGKIDPSSLKSWIINPYDEYAIEEALRLNEAQGGGTITIVSIGPEAIQEVIRKALAMGADERRVHVGARGDQQPDRRRHLWEVPRPVGGEVQARARLLRVADGGASQVRPARQHTPESIRLPSGDGRDELHRVRVGRRQERRLHRRVTAPTCLRCLVGRIHPLQHGTAGGARAGVSGTGLRSVQVGTSCGVAAGASGTTMVAVPPVGGGHGSR